MAHGSWGPAVLSSRQEVFFMQEELRLALLVEQAESPAGTFTKGFAQWTDRASLEGMVAIAEQNQETFRGRVNPY